MNTTPKILLTAAVAISGTLSLASCSASKSPRSERPNLLFIFPDQHRLFALSLWSDPAYRHALSTKGDPVHTPNLDKLAKQGVVFTQACSVFPLSSPYRGMLMSGMYSTKNGLDSNARKDRADGLRHDITCFTDVLAAEGYETAYVGKVHWERNEALFDQNDNYVGSTSAPGGHHMNAYDTYVPAGKGRHGNKFWFQHIKDLHFNAHRYSNQPQYVGGNKDGDHYKSPAPRLTTCIEADIVIDYINNEKGALRDEKRPFSMIWSINPPHNPYSKESDCEAVEFERFRSKTYEELLVRKNVSPKNEADKARLELTSKVYFSLISSVDREVGRVLHALEAKGLDENTIVVFTSDHGEMMGSHGKMGKPQVYEEAYLVPFFIKYKGKIAHRLDDLRLTVVDIMPTLLSMMGLKDRIPATVDGVDFAEGILTGDYESTGKPESTLYRAFEDRGVRNEKYTCIVSPDGQYSIFDLKADPYQTASLTLEDLAPADAKELKDQLGYWLKKADDQWVKEQKNKNLIHY